MAARVPLIREREIVERLPPDFDLSISAKTNSCQFESSAFRIEHIISKKVQKTYEKKYSANKKGLVELFSDPGLVIEMIIGWPIFVAAGVGAVVWKPDDNKFIKRHEEIISTTPIQSSISTSNLADVDRSISILIRSASGYYELIRIKTNKDGRFTFFFDKFIQDNNLKPDAYTIEFYHNEIREPKVQLISAANVVAIQRHGFSGKQKLNSQRIGKNAKNRIIWFHDVELAAGIVIDAQHAREIYRLYCKYRWTAVFARAVAVDLFPAAIAEDVVEQALFIVVKNALEKNGYTVEGLLWKTNPYHSVPVSSPIDHMFVSR